MEKDKIPISLFSLCLAVTSNASGFYFFTCGCEIQVVSFFILIKSHLKPFKILSPHAQHLQSPFYLCLSSMFSASLGKPPSVVSRCDIRLDHTTQDHLDIQNCSVDFSEPRSKSRLGKAWEKSGLPRREREGSPVRNFFLVSSS